MAHKVITIPNTLLRSKSRRIGFVDDSIKKLAEEMKLFPVDYDSNSEIGVALAAIQIGEPVRMTVVRHEDGHYRSDDFTTFINPEIVKSSTETISDFEGCLSIPQIYGRVTRPAMIKLKALDVNGEPIRLTARGFLARVFCHEIDHMDGVLFIDHVESPDDLYELADDGQLVGLSQLPAEIKKEFDERKN